MNSNVDTEVNPLRIPIKFCKICAERGFPNEGIFFVLHEVNRVYYPSNCFQSGREHVRTYWVPFDANNPRQIHQHKIRSEALTV